MQVLLRRDVATLGRLGAVVDVAGGYARNYLLPKKVAAPVTPENLKALERLRQEREQREHEERDRLATVAQRLEGFLCYMEARATETGHLFGSVGPEQIAEALAESGFEDIRPSSILMTGHFEQTGDYDVEAMLHPEVRVHFTVRIAPPGEQEGEQ